jgi:cardiolipin synthase
MPLWFSIVFTASGYMIALALIPRIVLQRRESGATLAWMLVIAFLPWFGLFFFWVFGTQRIRWRRRRRQRIEATVAPGIAATTEPLRRFEARAEESALAALSEPARSLALLADKLASRSTGGNSVDLLIDADATFSRIESALKSAESHVHLEYYIWRDDEVGRRLRDLCAENARRGIEVRILVDDVGSREANTRFWRPLLDAGGKVARFLPVNLVARRLVLNNRNHRKIVVADGRVAFVGGLNVGREYFGRNKSLGKWRDTHLRIEGPAVARFQEIFVEDWYHAAREDLARPLYFPDPAPAGSERVSVLASGPDDGRCHAIEMILFAALAAARQRAWLTTPYFVPSESILHALQLAALRGVDVRLLLPSRLDEKIVLHAGRSFYPELLEAGVQIFEYADALLHAKTATIDGCWATVGSANMDRRSFALNFEANAVSYGPLLARELERVFERDIERAIRIEASAFRQRAGTERLLEGAARVLAPIL